MDKYWYLETETIKMLVNSEIEQIRYDARMSLWWRNKIKSEKKEEDNE